MKRLRLLSFLFTIVIFFSSCNSKNSPVEKGFYYWKTNLSFSQEELQRLSELRIKKLYTRFCDVSIEGNIPRPLAKITMGSMPPSTVVIIPVIFITNKTFTLIAGKQIDSLAENIAKLISHTAAIHEISYREIQFDCDWSLTTKEKYFYLLQQIKKAFPSKILSCTIRLHQVKYSGKTGIPPVDRGMLMFYNMGDVQSVNINSIFNEKDARKYASYLSSYSLPLDVALPIFGWIKHYRNNRIIELISELNEADLQQDSGFVFISRHRYAALKNMFYSGRYLKQDDMFVAEDITPDIAENAALFLKKYFKSDSCTVVLYHWHRLNLSRYDNKDIENIYSAFQ